MRYVAKIHVLDVLDQVVVSGYCYDASGQDPDGHPSWEFTYGHRGIGLDDDHEWLIWALYQTLLQMAEPAARRVTTGSTMGGPHTLSETGDSPQ